MRIDGVKIEGLATGEVKLPRPGGTFIKLTVQAVALGDEGKGERLFPEVRPPSDFVYDKKGNIVRDPFTKSPLRESNTFDPGYVASAEEASRMQLIVKAVDCIASDKTVHWETEATPGTKDYYVALAEELRVAGFTLGDLRLILDEARKLGNLDSKKLEEAAESFSSEGA